LDVAAKTNDGNTALHYFTRTTDIFTPDGHLTKYMDTLEKMVKLGASVNDQNINGETPLHETCLSGLRLTSQSVQTHTEFRAGSPYIVRYLVKYCKADINRMTFKGFETPLHYAVRRYYSFQIQRLVSSITFH